MAAVAFVERLVFCFGCFVWRCYAAVGRIARDQLSLLGALFRRDAVCGNDIARLSVVSFVFCGSAVCAVLSARLPDISALSWMCVPLFSCVCVVRHSSAAVRWVSFMVALPEGSIAFLVMKKF